MSNRVSRYSLKYQRTPRPNSVTPFPKHVFMRTQNRHQEKAERLGDRTN